LKELTLAEAADIYEARKRELDQLKPELEAAAKKLKEHFRKTGRHHFKNRIGYSRSSRTVLDQDKVKRYLGKRLSSFMKDTPVESLTLLK
jgi:hypothetical protein